MARLTLGLPMRNKPKGKQRKVDGHIYKVRQAFYGSSFIGWYLYKDGKRIKFNNGGSLDNPFDINEALEFTIKTLKDKE